MLKLIFPCVLYTVVLDTYRTCKSKYTLCPQKIYYPISSFSNFHFFFAIPFISRILLEFEALYFQSCQNYYQPILSRFPYYVRTNYGVNPEHNTRSRLVYFVCWITDANQSLTTLVVKHYNDLLDRHILVTLLQWKDWNLFPEISADFFLEIGILMPRYIKNVPYIVCMSSK